MQSPVKVSTPNLEEQGVLSCLPYVQPNTKLKTKGPIISIKVFKNILEITAITGSAYLHLKKACTLQYHKDM